MFKSDETETKPFDLFRAFEEEIFKDKAEKITLPNPIGTD